MTTLQRIATVAAASGLSLGLAFAAAAANAPKPVKNSININVRGKVVLTGAISKVDLVAKSFGVKVWGTEWTVKVADNTRLAPKGRGAVSLADLAVDHVVHVTGQVDAAAPLTITARKVVNQSIVRKAAAYTGSITALAPPDAFTLQLTRGGQLTVKVTADTKITEGDVTKAYADLAVSVPVVVKGAYDSATNTLTAEKIVLRPEDAEDAVRGFEKSNFKGRGPQR